MKFWNRPSIVLDGRTPLQNLLDFAAAILLTLASAYLVVIAFNPNYEISTLITVFCGFWSLQLSVRCMTR